MLLNGLAVIKIKSSDIKWNSRHSCFTRNLVFSEVPDSDVSFFLSHCDAIEVCTTRGLLFHTLSHS